MQRVITILVLLLVLGLVASGLYLIILGPEGAITQVKVAILKAGDQEAAFLHPATTIATWERFVAGLKELPGITIDDSAAFPEDSMKLPVVGLRVPGAAGTLWIRWYKLTGQRTIEHWVQELCHRQPAPLVIIGGGNSERARDIALQLQRQQAGHPGRKLPVFLITTATAENVQHADLGEVELMKIYSGRTFRYCFTNRQMAEAILDFVREQVNLDSNLQITSSRVSLISWNDDPFSEDLVQQFEELWHVPTESSANPPVWKYRIAHSVGSFQQPNKLEAAAIQKLIQDFSLEQASLRGRELLVLPGGPAPARRVLRSLYRTDPNERIFWVVTVGDAIDWNTLYRDRRLTWSIEDVPFPLIAFMHRNPVETSLSQGRCFVPDTSANPASNSTGTDDLLLYRDIGQSLLFSCFRTQSMKHDQPANVSLPCLVQSADEVLASLIDEKDSQGQRLFDELGNRVGKGGEFITLLRPVTRNYQLLPQGLIEVYGRQSSTRQWFRLVSLEADYSTFSPVPRGKP